MTQYEKLNFVNGSPPAVNAATLNHIEDGIATATEGVTALEETVKNNKTETDTALKDKPGFDDVYTVAEADEHFLSKYDAGNTYATKTNLITKADKATTYTKDETDTLLSNKLDNTAGSVTTNNIASKAVTSDKIANGAITALKLANGAVSGSNIAQNQIGTNHLQSSAVTTDKLADEVKTSINSKYDSSNVETGGGSLTPGTSYTDLVKSSTFAYQKSGKIVNIFFNIVFNECSANYVQFKGLPFLPNETSEQNRHMGISNKNIQAAVYPVQNTLVLNFLGTKNLVQDEVFKDVLIIEIG